MRAHCHPYIGGDSMKAKGMPVAVCDLIPSLNLVLPFAIPSFLGKSPTRITTTFP